VATGAWIQQTHLAAYMGFGQGFLAYRERQGRAPRLTRAFLDWARAIGRHAPFFAYLHYIDLHDPYRPEPPFDRLYGETGDVYAGVDFARWGAARAEINAGVRRLAPGDLEQLVALYDGQLTWVDRRIGELFDGLRRLGLYDASWIVLTSDHGEGFMEHGFISHSSVPYEELVRVPLLVKLPRGEHGGARVARQVRIVDVMPTLLEATGAAAAAALDGASLLPLIRGDAERSAAFPELAITEWKDSVAVRSEALKLIRLPDGRAALYDLAADPGERTDVLGARAAEAAPLVRAAEAVLAARGTQARPRVVLGADEIEELRALGYVE
jgi:arylsulfatase A-like enzyme